MAKKKNITIVQAEELELWQVYVSARYIDREDISIRFLIPTKHDDNGIVMCKLVKVEGEGDNEKLVVDYARYGASCSFIEVDMKNDEDWLRVLEIEKRMKQNKGKENEQPKKKKRGRPKKKQS